jgi:acyl-CoA oxidase
MRKQFGNPKSDIEQPILDYELHQYRLFPYLASAFSIRNTFVYIKQSWNVNQKKIFKPGNFTLNELHALLSAMKAFVSW